MKKALLSAMIICATVQTDKKLKLEVTIPQAEMIMRGLSECDCPQKQAAELRNYLQAEYARQFPAPDTTAKKDTIQKKK